MGFGDACFSSFSRWWTSIKRRQIRLADVISSVGVTMIGCICLYVLIDVIGFSGVHPLTFADGNYSLYPPSSYDRTSITTQYDGIGRFTQFVRGAITIGETASDVESLIQLTFTDAGRVVHTHQISTNTTGAPFIVFDSRSISCDSISVRIHCQGAFSDSSFLNLRFDFGSSGFFFRKFLFRASFFIVCLTFLCLFLKRFLSTSFKAISSILLLVLSLLSSDPFILLLNTKSAVIADAVFHRFFISGCKFCAAISLLFPAGSIRARTSRIVTIAIISVCFVADVAAGIATDCIFAAVYFAEPTRDISGYGGVDIASLVLLGAEALAVLVVVVGYAENDLLSLFGFVLLCGNEAVVMVSARNYDNGMWFVVGMAVPHIFACDYVAKRRKAQTDWAKIESDDSGEELEDQNPS
jgi:hypothetical protein